MNRPWNLLHVAPLALVVCCGGQSSPPSATPNANTNATDESTTAPVFEGTIGLTEVSRAGSVATLTAVRAASHEGFDRVVFELADADTLPGYHIEYIDKPAHDCGSGDAKEIAGEAWLEVRMSPENAHTEAGEPTIAFREQAFDLPVIVELERTCDFEAVTTWVIGLRSPNRYRVMELSDPPRLVVDIAHTTQSPQSTQP